ncbi:MAG: hypothetical protein L5656_08190 [Thermanaeromonas sp.]|nr:hypothetical protein [Thermanaeromonas sp.]
MLFISWSLTLSRKWGEGPTARFLRGGCPALEYFVAAGWRMSRVALTGHGFATDALDMLAGRNE